MSRLFCTLWLLSCLLFRLQLLSVMFWSENNLFSPLSSNRTNKHCYQLREVLKNKRRYADIFGENFGGGLRVFLQL
uniref:Putative secreted protein n=1 Tax=Ixodes ricinus TaxID=34613 RepID=A0A6B0TTT4_IXORI